MEIKRSGTQPSTKGRTEYFTGTVCIDPLFQANIPARSVGASVTFEHRARTAWNTHPLGQILIVIYGCGPIQRGCVSKSIEEIHPGDGFDSIGCKALAWCNYNHGHDPYRYQRTV
jgi:quercetin dioxygenase-like cupin family protein